MPKYIPYNKDLKQLSRNLRNNSEKSEIYLWNELRASKLGYGFNRQKPLLNYIVDFYAKKLKLIIEIDGITHFNEETYIKDMKRQKELESYGLNILRFSDDEVLNDMENVLRVIKKYTEEFEQK